MKRALLEQICALMFAGFQVALQLVHFLLDSAEFCEQDFPHVFQRVLL
jgi:hypothetical protein